MAVNDPMQQEAMKRVREMQSRIPLNQNRNKQNNSTQNKVPDAISHTAVNTHKPAEQEEQNDFEHSNDKKICDNKNSLDFLFKNKEENLILMLVVLLSDNNENRGLLLALIYLLI